MIHIIFGLLGILLLTISQHLPAATKYVTDDLQLALHEQAGSKGKLLDKLPSGTKLEVLEEDGFFAKVRTPDGTEGWTKAGFLMLEKPARARVGELEQAKSQLEQELEQVREQLKASTQQLAEIRAEKIQTALELADEKERKQTDASLISRLQEDNARLQEHLEPAKEIRIPLDWGLIGSAVALLFGMLGGFTLFDWLSRRRHGGIRIY